MAAQVPRARRSWLLWHPLAGMAARLVIGAVFIYAGVGKIANPADFARAIYAYRVLHVDLVNLVAIWLPWVELLAGACLILGAGRRSAAAVIAGMVALFIVVAWLGVIRELDIECGCFLPAVMEGRLGWPVLLRHAALLALSVYALYHPSDAWSLDRVLG